MPLCIFKKLPMKKGKMIFDLDQIFLFCLNFKKQTGPFHIDRDIFIELVFSKIFSTQLVFLIFLDQLHFL